MDANSKHKDWQVWKDSMDLVELVCNFDWDETYDSRIKNSVISIPSNIARGAGKGKGYTANILRVAKGACAETDTLIISMERLKLITSKDAKKILELTESVLTQLGTLIKSIEARALSSL